MKKRKIIKKMSMLQEGEIENIIDWKIWYDRDNKKPCGKQNNYVVVAGLDEMLPNVINKPPQIEERQAVLLIFKKKKEKKR